MIVVPVQGNEEIFSLSCTETLGGVNEGVVKRNPLKDLAFRGLYNQKICFLWSIQDSNLPPFDCQSNALAR